MDLSELIARELVRDTIARYAHLVDRGKFDELVELFTEDGTLDTGPGPPARGRAAVRQVFVQTGTRLTAAAIRPLIRHHVSSIQIDLAGADSARAYSYFLAVTERGPDHWGRYHDDLARRGDRWLFHHRRVRVDGHAPASILARDG
jgi:ketosteroid isomerase-like protein